LTLDWYTIDGGGVTRGAGGTLILAGTIGQADAGRASYESLLLSGGFWLGGEAPSYVPEIPGNDSDLPSVLRIVAGLPNPFHRTTGIHLELPAPQPVEALVFDYSGRLVSSLYRGIMPAGRHRLEWNGKSRSGHRVASGVYLVQVQAGERITRQQVVLLR
jgi:hypothetical protein